MPPRQSCPTLHKHEFLQFIVFWPCWSVSTLMVRFNASVIQWGEKGAHTIFRLRSSPEDIWSYLCLVVKTWWQGMKWFLRRTVVPSTLYPPFRGSFREHLKGITWKKIVEIKTFLVIFFSFYIQLSTKSVRYTTENKALIHGGFSPWRYQFLLWHSFSVSFWETCECWCFSFCPKSTRCPCGWLDSEN